MEFYIKKNSTLPKLQVEVINESRNGYNQLDQNISASTVTFSMYHVDTEILKIANSPAIVKLLSDGSGYVLSYQFSKKNTNRTGRYKGVFTITNNRGIYEVPISETLYIQISDSFANSDMCCRRNTIRITLTPTPSSTPTPTITPTNTPTVTTTVTPTVTPSLTSSTTPTVTPTSSLTPTVTPTETPTNTPTNTVTPSITSTSSITPTPTPTNTPTVTTTVTPTVTPSLTSSTTPTVTPTSSVTSSITPTETPTNTPTNTVTPSITPTKTPTNTPTNTVTPSITPTSSITPSLSPTETPSVTPTSTVTPTPSTTPFSSNLLVFLDSGNPLSYSGTGDTWFDLEGTSNDATLFNSPTFIPSYQGILQFDDSSLQYATIPNIGDLSTWTVEVWFRLTSSLTGKVTSIISNEFDLLNKLNFSIGTNNAPINTNLSVGFYDGSWRTTTGVVPNLDTWYQVVGTYDGTTIEQYVNGVASGGTVNYVGTPQSGGEIRLMRRWDMSTLSSNLVNGDLAIVKIYSSALNSGEVLSNYNSTYTRFLDITPTPTPSITP